MITTRYLYLHFTGRRFDLCRAPCRLILLAGAVYSALQLQRGRIVVKPTIVSTLLPSTASAVGWLAM